MPEYELTFEAEEDFLGIARYTVKTWGEANARVCNTALKMAFSAIAAHPNIGRVLKKTRPMFAFCGQSITTFSI